MKSPVASAIGWQISLALAAIYAFLTTALILAIFLVDKASTTTNWIRNDVLYKFSLSNEIQKNARSEQLGLYSLFLALNRDSRVQAYATIDKNKAALLEAVDRLGRMPNSAAERELLTRIVKARQLFQEQYDETVDIVELGDVERAKQQMNRKTMTALDAMVGEIESYVDYQRSQIDAHVEVINGDAQQSRQVSMVFALLAVCVAALSVLAITAYVRKFEGALEGRVSERTNLLNEANRKLDQLSRTDALTGVANRRHFDEVLEAEWLRAMRISQKLSVCMLDVDYFKNFNDTYGHVAGDDCLRKIAELLARHVSRAGELTARFGGEEFAVILPNSGLEDAVQAAQRICCALFALQLEHAGSPHKFVSLSVGVACMTPLPGSSHTLLLEQADAALYLAKRGGRNRVASAAHGPEADQARGPTEPSLS